MEKENFIILKEALMKAIMSMVKKKDLEYIILVMEVIILANLKMDYLREKAL